MTGEDGTVALLGAGGMGHGMATSLLRAGVPTVVWNRHPEAVRDLVDKGARTAATPAEAVRDAAVAITMVTDADAVLAVAAGMLDALPPGAVWAQMSTIGPAGTQRAAELVAARRPDVLLLDAPVVGSVGPAEAGMLTILASGDDAARDRVARVFDALGQRTLWLGPVGQGSRLKLVNNTLLALTAEAIAESVALARRLGFGANTVLAAFEGGPLLSAWATAKLKRMAADEYSAEFPLALALKDVRLALAEGAGGYGVLSALAEEWQRAADAGLAGQDVTAVTRALATR